MEKTIKVKDTTLEMLKKLKEEKGFSSIDETIVYLLKVYRSERLKEMFGIDMGRIAPFSREDRIEDRDG